MKIAIVGSGAMGGALATALVLSGNKVSVLDASTALVDHINEHGITVTTPDGETVSAKPFATADPSAIGPVDLVVVLVKSQHTAAVALSMQPLLHAQTAVLSLQNGWGNTDVLAEQVPREQLIYGVTYNSCNVAELGRVGHTGRGETYIGDFIGGVDRAQAIAPVLTAAGWNATATPSAATEVWKKLILNSVSLPLSSLAHLPAVEVVAFAPIGALAEEVTRESCEVARAMGFDIDTDERIAAIIATNTRAGQGKSSMLQDVELRRKTEIEVVNGAVVKAAESQGVPAPLNRALAQLVAGLERSWQLES